MGLLKFEWDKDLHGDSVLVVRKSRGKISVSELQEEMSRDYRFQGGWAVLFKTQEDSYQGWDLGGGKEPKGDVLELYRIGDGESCPVCAATFSGIECCPHCGERIKEK